MSKEAEQAQRRDLSAILFADVHGYSRLMGMNEELTSQRVTQSINLLKSLVGDYGGEVKGISGDGVLALFKSASQSLKFAIQVQREFRNDAAWNSEDERIAFRMGINLGDVFQTETGVQGHSVNIAARIQDLAPPGGICISDSVRRSVPDTPGVRIRSIGQPALKNIPERIQLYQVEDVTLDTSPPTLPTRHTEIQSPAKGSIAVLPLTNLSGNVEDNHICDGVTGDIITNLSRFRELLVISQNSAFLFRDQNLSVEEIGRNLGVSYLVTGGFQRIGTNIRIRVQLVEATSGQVIWSEHFDGSLSDIFTFQDDVTAVIASRLSIEIAAKERHRQLTAAPSDVRAYGLVLRGRELSLQLAEESNLHARRLFEQAAEIDPEYARSYVGISRTYNKAWRFRWADPSDQSLEKAARFANLAIELDPLDSRGYAALGLACLYLRQHEEALAAYERAIQLNPNDADALAETGHTYSCLGEGDRAEALIMRAMRLNPYYPDWYIWHLGEVYFDKGDYQKAIATLNRMHDKGEAYRLLAASHALLGQMEEAHKNAELLKGAQPHFNLEHWSTVPPDRNPEPRDRFIEGLRKAGLE